MSCNTYHFAGTLCTMPPLVPRPLIQEFRSGSYFLVKQTSDYILYACFPTIPIEKENAFTALNYCIRRVREICYNCKNAYLNFHEIIAKHWDSGTLPKYSMKIAWCSRVAKHCPLRFSCTHWQKFWKVLSAAENLLTVIKTEMFKPGKIY